MKLETKIICITLLQWICVIIAAAMILQPSPYILFDVIGTLIWLALASICEWVKYCITHDN